MISRCEHTVLAFFYYLCVLKDMINEVRNTVLAILNKENKGYITPETFNLYADMAQNEVFNEHFKAYANAKLKRINRYAGESFADEAKRHAEIIELFYANAGLTSQGGGTYIMPSDVRHIEIVSYGATNIPIEKVSKKELWNMNQSLLTQPSLLFPVYNQYGNNIVVSPSTINSTVTLNYIRQPYKPKWTWVTLSGGEPVFNQGANDYKDFELPQDDFVDLTIKILQYCGLSIREADVVNVANNEEQENKA